MIKKIFKFFLISGVILLLLAAAGGFVLYKMYPPAKLKGMAQEYVSKKLHRELSFDQISFTWIGFTLTNVALSEQNTFQDGTFVKADKLTAHVAVKPLLKKRIEIDTIEAEGLQINLVTQKDGSFNFDTLFSSQEDPSPSESPAQPEQTEAEPLVLTAQTIALRDCDITYQNEQTGLQAAAKDLTIEIRQFDLADPFEVLIAFTTEVAGLGQPENITVPVELSLRAFLADLELSKAYVEVAQLTADYQTVKLNLSGDIKNLKSPAVNLTGTLTGITNRVFAAFAPDLPNFNLPTVNLTLQALVDLDTSTAQISQARLAVQDSFLAAQGSVDWGRAVPAYQLQTSLKANLGQIVQMTDTLDGFRPGGTLSGNFQMTDKKDNTDIRGTVTLKDISAFYEPFTLTQTNGTVKLASLTEITVPSLTGKLNDQSFSASFSYKELQDVQNLTLKLDLEKLVLKSFATSGQETAESAPAESPTSAEQADSTSMPMNIQAEVNIGGVDIPYLQAEGFTLLANLSGVTDSMANANGNVNFTLKPGKITNLDNFIKDSKIAKILLLPVAVVKKISGLLKLGLFPADTSGQGTTVAFTQAEGQYVFTDGVMNLEKTVFNSSVTEITASGEVNFRTQALNMKAIATVLTQAAPVAIKITGTINEPKGKLDVLNTVTSVVGGLLNGTAVKSAARGGASATEGTAKLTTDTVKGTVNTAADVVKGIGGLFKKKKSDSPQDPS